ncbi:MAG TPA: M56 family metallopeptidase [Acidobacteriota bacterium]|nr:M56 family metallopeptidase [Acidobacteriota bacterium]
MITELIGGIGSLAGPISHTLIHSLWQGGAIALFLTLAFFLLRRGDAKIRCALACTGLIAIFVTTIATGVYFISTDAGLSGGFVDGLVAGVIAQPSAVPEQTEPGPFSVAATHTPAEGETATIAGGDFIPPIEWVFPLWIVGVALLTLRHLVGWRRAKALIRQGTGDLPAALAARMKRLCRTLAISRPVRFLTSAVVQVPCVVGWLKPVVLIPLSTLAGIAPENLELIIIHELAHIRRHDVLIGYLQAVAETLLFFNPAVWWISRQIRVEREHCCDDLAIAMGDRFRYIRTLIDLDELRDKKGALVMAANNTSLLHRVRRLIGPSPEPVSLPGAGVAGAFLLAAFLVLGSGLTTDLTPVETLAAPRDGILVNVGDDDSDVEGTWELEIRDGKRAQLSMRFARDWRTGTTVRLSDLSPAIDVNTTSFKMARDAGIFYFEGSFEEYRGELLGDGTCHFRSNGDYIKKMRDYGIQFARQRDVFNYGIHNISLEYTRGLADLGYDNLGYKKLLEAHIHDVTPEYVRELDRLGYRKLPMKRLVEMQIHDVTPEFIEELAELGYRDLSPDQLVEFSIHDVDPEFIREMAALGYKDLSPDRLVELQIHDVTPQAVREYHDQGHNDLTTDDLVQMQIHDVTPENVQEWADLGYDDLSRETLVELNIHDVEPRDVEAYAELGYRNLHPDELVKMSIYDVRPRTIREWAELGYRDLSVERLVELQIHDVEPEDVQAFADLGYEKLDPETLVKMSIHDVTPRYIRGWAELGYRSLSTERLVELQIHDVDPRDVREYAELGYRDLSPDELVAMSIHDVTPRFIRELTALGYDDLSVERLIEFQIHDVTPSYIKGLAERGVRNLTPDELVGLKIYGP